MRRSISLMAFDLDGTLVDSRRDIADAANALLAECGAAPMPEADLGRMVGDGAATLIARAFRAAQIPLPADALPRFLKQYDARLMAHTRPYDGIDAVLSTLRERSALAVLTNKPIAATRQILDGLDLARYFAPALVFGGDGPHPRKPDPAGLMTLASAAGADVASTVLVGDSVVDWRTARAAGAVPCVARYGFGFEGFPEDLLQAGDAVIDTPYQLLDL